MNLPLEAIRAFIGRADHVEVTGDLPELSIRLRHLLGLTALGVATLGLAYSAAWQANQAHHTSPAAFETTRGDHYDPGVEGALPPMTQEARPVAPTASYRLEITDEADGRVVTSVLIDPAQWDPMDQTAFVLKLARQADERGFREQRSLALSVMASDGQVQEAAVRFVDGTLKESGVSLLPPAASFGEAVSPTHPAGLRFNGQVSALDALGSDPCLVQTGDAIGCEQAATAEPPRTLGQALNLKPTPVTASAGRTRTMRR